MNSRFVFKFIVGIALSACSYPSWSASCCGGGSASTLILPKYNDVMVNVVIDRESYEGYWNQLGNHTPDPPGADLAQNRFNAGIAYRLADRWQAGLSLGYVWNENQYSGMETNTNGLGDSVASLWYEHFDDVTCIYKIDGWKSLKPAFYFGMTLTLPTGESPYDRVENSFDITGRGFYRIDGNVLIEKTIYPWSVSLLYSYGIYRDRPVNREYGTAIAPYNKGLGNRSLMNLSLGYTHDMKDLKTLTYTFALTDLEEADGTVDGLVDPTTGFKKKSMSVTTALSNLKRDWIFNVSWNHALDRNGRGENFPTTDIVTFGVSHVFL